MNVDRKIIEEVVKRVLMEQLKEKPKPPESFQKERDISGITLIKTDSVKTEKFHTGKEEDQVFLKDVLDLDESPRLGCGIMEMKESVFDWTLKYDEIDYIIDGTLEIIIGGRKVTGKKGDIIYIPRNKKIKFSCPDYARFLYVVYPANWSQLS